MCKRYGEKISGTFLCGHRVYLFATYIFNEHLVCLIRDESCKRAHRRRLAVPNVTVHSDPSKASVPITVVLCQLLCVYNLPINRLKLYSLKIRSLSMDV